MTCNFYCWYPAWQFPLGRDGAWYTVRASAFQPNIERYQAAYGHNFPHMPNVVFVILLRVLARIFLQYADDLATTTADSISHAGTRLR
jgi:hypothetical protein